MVAAGVRGTDQRDTQGSGKYRSQDGHRSISQR
jgi:hypothetical protein